ncbi:ABC transporter ATP-binding protein [Leptospira ryugenii]|nr:ABC transporter ATP-binding protein [Leptospira ryugenii]
MFKLYLSNLDRLKESLNIFGKKYHKEFFALNDINLSIKKGEAVAIIGQNGSGKSTLLKIITGILSPSAGNVSVKGRISSLLELGTGFNPDLTGRENIYFYGTINGIPKDKMSEKINDIIEFADIGKFLDQPVRSYSSGMFVRLAFACAIQIDPEILIVDEALAVGDMRFVQKCFRKMLSFKEREKTLILVTHDMPSVIAFSSRVIWIEDGKIIKDGEPNLVVRDYVSKMSYSQKSNVENSLINVHGDLKIEECESFGEKGAVFTYVHLEFGDRPYDSLTEGNEILRFRLKLKSHSELPNPGIGILLKDEKGYPVFGVNNYVYNRKISPLKNGDEIEVVYEVLLPRLRVGKYSFTIALSDGDQENHVQHHFIHDLITINYISKEDRYKLGSLLILSDDDFRIKVEKK